MIADGKVRRVEGLRDKRSATSQVIRTRRFNSRRHRISIIAVKPKLGANRAWPVGSEHIGLAGLRRALESRWPKPVLRVAKKNLGCLSGDRCPSFQVR